MFVAATAAASSAILLALAGQNARNMIQTAGIRRDEATLAPPTINPLETDSGMSTVECLRAMNREDLLRVFASSRPPTLSEMKEWFSSDDNNDASDSEFTCDWDGELLDNNSAFMNWLSSFTTHNLFGGISLPWRFVGESSKAKGRWKGKAFAKPTTTGTSGRGINRFDSATSPTGLQRHAFDYDIVQSKIVPGDGSVSLRLDYSKHQSIPISLWTSMRDELRVVELPPDRNTDDGKGKTFLLIGMGWIEFFGGPLNCSPFLLTRCRRK